MGRSKRWCLVLVSMIPFFGLVFLFGRTDLGFSLLFGVVFLVLWGAAYDVQMVLRNSVKVFFEKGSVLRAFFEKSGSAWQLLGSAAFAFILSIIFSLVAKGAVISHGVVPVFFLLLICAFFVSYFLGSAAVKGIQDRNISKDAASASGENEGSPKSCSPIENKDGDIKAGRDGSESAGAGGDAGRNVLGLILAIVVINVVLAGVLSAKDLHSFFVSNVGYDYNSDLGQIDFIEYAENNQVPSLGGNEISRPLINMYLILDAFKLASANEFLDIWGFSDEDRLDGFYAFYALVFLFNLLKMMPLSIAMVLLQRGMVDRVFPVFHRLFCLVPRRHIAENFAKRSIAWLKGGPESRKESNG
ncbi:hypothetical protein ACN2MM_08435 [Alkalilimnicola ehrlichii MLHE-1]|uniref:hypothetical protein n=1 Tax=Alkalilimnicola ehrlichii TaxID=351052 RepID=UPI001E57AC4B|nr:hypothetical protein [Alkalilimnicola ehrlichii]